MSSRALAFAAALALAGTAAAAIEWNEDLAADTGPACWINPVEGGTMAWEIGAPHFATTKGGPMLTKVVVLPPGATDLAERVVEADRAIRQAAFDTGMRIGRSTAVLVDLSLDGSANGGSRVTVAVPVMPGETNVPLRASGVERLELAASKVAHLRHEGPLAALDAPRRTLEDFIAATQASADGAGLSLGRYVVTEYYDLELDSGADASLVELCIQVSQN